MKAILAAPTALLVWVAAAQIPGAQTGDAQKLDAILDKLNRSAINFKGMTADLTQTAHTAVINEDQVASGFMRVKREHHGDTRMLVVFDKPDPKTVSLQGDTLSIYLPRLNTVQLYSLGKNSGLIEQFLLLGFGTTRQDLAASNTILYGGADTVHGRAATRIELIPKSKEVLQHITKIDLWLDTATGYPLQHQLWQQGGDYELFSFQNLRMNPLDRSEGSLKLQMPKNVKVERPQQ